MQLSIICPVFNIGNRFEAFWTHLSALGAASLPLEIIVVDDGSRDNTADLLEARMAEPTAHETGLVVRLLRQTNQGLSAARNNGLAQATGHYVLFLDDDDEIFADALPAMLDLARSTHADVINLPYIERSTSDELMQAPVPAGGVWSGQTYFIHLLMEHDRFVVPAWAYCYRREFLMAQNLRFKPGIYHEDCLFTPQAIIQAPALAVFGKPVYLYIRRPDSITISTDTSKLLKRLRDLDTVIMGLVDYRESQHPNPHPHFAASVNRWAAFLLNYQYDLAQGNETLARSSIPVKTALRLLASDPEYFMYSAPHHHWYRSLFKRILRLDLSLDRPDRAPSMLDPFSRFQQKLKLWNRGRIARRRGALPPMPVPELVQKVSARPVDMGNAQTRSFIFRPERESDREVIKQVFEDHGYDLRQWIQGRQIHALFDKRAAAGISSFIVDAGAGIGGTAVFFSRCFPAVKMVCVEPEPENFELLGRNTAGMNVTLVRGALGAEPAQMFLQGHAHSLGGPRVQAEPRTGSQPVQVFCMRQLEEGLPNATRPLVCKIDLQGGEDDLFSKDTRWIDRYPLIVIQLHDWMLPGQRTSANFLREIASREIDFLHKGENIYVFNTRLIEIELAQLDAVAVRQ